ncbi:MAG: hypothetical protein IPK60_15455 [Sandaracinaceae bacterium]|jgi:hypothetical protein|nr:hypothetical protein [Sandaracinaceae bacterium]
MSIETNLETQQLNSTVAELPIVVIQREGRWMKLPTGRFVDMKAHRVLGGIVRKLAEERIVSPSIPVPPQRLVESGWPGENIQPKAAKNRLHVALSTLRKMGLQDALITTPAGYMLNPALTMRVEAA